MKRTIGSILLGTSLLCGCGENSGVGPINPVASRVAYHGPTTAESQEVVATVSGEPITMQQLMEPLIESHGLTILANLVQLELAKQAAAKAHVPVTKEDFDNEYNLTLDRLFKDYDDKKLIDAIDEADRAKNAELAANLREQLRLERDDYLTQFLNNQHLDRVDFDIVLKMNAYLRKIAEPQVAKQITEDAVQRVFGQLYGERVEVEYIQLPNMVQVGVAQRRLANGDSFEKVAQAMSTDRATASLGGALPAFSRESAGVPAAFKQAAFTLADGQVGDVVSVGSSFMLIKRIRLDAPQAVKFDDVKEACARQLHDSLMDVAMKELQKQLAYEARTQIDIMEPVLARQWQEKLDRDANAAERAAKELDKDQVRKDLHRLIPATAPSTDKNSSRTVPAGPAAPKADSAAADERPPATQPG